MVQEQKKSKKKFNELKDRFSKSKIKEIRKDLYEIENKKNLSTLKIKKIEKNFLELEKNLSKLKNYYDYDDIGYKGMKDVKNLFDLSIDEDYCKPIKANDAFNSHCIEYKSKGGKNKTLSIKDYLNMIRPYLRDIINNYKSHGEWKIQLTMIINFISSNDSDETCTIYTKSTNI